MAKKNKCKSGGKNREKSVVTFNEAHRQEYLTGFHKRKVERRKAAVVEIKNKLKEEQKRVREERRKEYLKMLKERNEALEEADELEDLVTSTTECQQYDYPNHTVTVTTISDLDLTAAARLPPAPVAEDVDGREEEPDDEEKPSKMPKKAGVPILSKKLCSLTASLHAHTKQRRKGAQRDGRNNRKGSDRKSGSVDRKPRLGKTSKRQRRRQTGKTGHCQD